jgi:hypothetical protein
MQEKLKLTLIHSISAEELSNKTESWVIYILNLGLYKGLDSAILRQFIYCGMRLGIYKALEDRVKLNDKRNLTFG